MVAATGPWKGLRTAGSNGEKTVGGGASGSQAPALASSGIVALLTGCVQDRLLRRVNAATARVLDANGFELVQVPTQACCGALHAHSGDLAGARKLARQNIAAFEGAGIDLVVVNAAGCGAAMKEYGHLLSGDPELAERASAFSAKVVDISEALVGTELRTGGQMAVAVAYDAPCHLHHAQKITAAPIDLLETVPGLRLVQLDKPDECCGGAGIYGITHPELGGRIGRDKVRDILNSGADVVATGNPGCMMQIGAGLLMEKSDVGVVHPIELIDESYRRGGVYTGGRNT
jgi:glycolate oxidase iron-sulfur subunit